MGRFRTKRSELLRPGRVPGAFLTGKTWNIPDDAEKPARANAKASIEPNALLARLLEEKRAGVHGGIYHKLQIELTYNSNHMEGSRLSMDQTRFIFETSTIGFEGESIKVDDVIEAANHFHCIDCVLENAQKPLSERLIKELHRTLKDGTSDSRLPWFAVGDYKTLPNEVANMTTTRPEGVAGEIGELLREYDPKAAHTLEQIIELHVKFERIHPFQDGNGRVGRLIMLKECLASNVVPFVIADSMKAYYYRGLSEWNQERGYLTETCLAAQDRFKTWMDYFRIPHGE